MNICSANIEIVGDIDQRNNSIKHSQIAINLRGPATFEMKIVSISYKQQTPSESAGISLYKISSNYIKSDKMIEATRNRVNTRECLHIFEHKHTTTVPVWQTQYITSQEFSAISDPTSMLELYFEPYDKPKPISDINSIDFGMRLQVLVHIIIRKQ